ncbi:MAG TPA: PQQ-dependent sugar dehydrogenase [Thermoanaerobaculia bacterium]
MRLLFLLLGFSLSLRAQTEILPGFRIETLAAVPGFVSSVVTDSKGTIYCTTTNGWIHRIDGGQSVPVASLPTRAGGNGGLLGMALLDDATAVVHYTTWQQGGSLILDDVVAEVELATGALKVLKAFPGDIEFRERGVSDEHHGGNLTIAPDGSIFVGIGEYGYFALAQDPRWNGGKIWRLDRDGNAEQFARGVRNPYDLAWDPLLGRLVFSDNGPSGGDEIHVIDAGANAGWPESYGNQPPFEGSVPPVYVFPNTVAPTGLARLSGANALLAHGYFSAGFVTRSLYFFDDLAAKPVPAPVAVVSGFPQFILDVTEGPNGEIFLATAMGSNSAIHRLHVPPRGDCNGDGLTDARDILPTIREVDDSNGGARIDAQKGDYRGSWGCDANVDNVIDAADVAAVRQLVGTRRRSARS